VAAEAPRQGIRVPGVNGAVRASAPAAIPVRAASVEEAEGAPWEELRQDEAPEAIMVAEDASVGPAKRAARSPRKSASSIRLQAKPGPALWWGLGIGGAALFVLVVGVVLIVALSGRSGPRKLPPREPIRVDPRLNQTLGKALEGAREGDRIVLQGDITEADLSVRNVKNLTIEAEPGKRVQWRFPPTAVPEAKLLLLESTENFLLKGITLSGEDRAQLLINLFGHCPGARFENLELMGYRKYGLLITNCQGTSDRRVSVSQVRFVTRRGSTALHFDIVPRLPIRENRFFSLRDCTFDGEGRKVTTRTGAPLDTNTLDLTQGIKLEAVR
jgi:hypothetical protein